MELLISSPVRHRKRPQLIAASTSLGTRLTSLQGSQSWPPAFFFRSPRRLAAHCPGPVSWPILSRYRCSLSDLRRPLDRLAQPLHGEFDVLGLQLTPAFHLGLVAIFRKAFEVLRGQLPSGRAFLGELEP